MSKNKLREHLASFADVFDHNSLAPNCTSCTSYRCGSGIWNRNRQNGDIGFKVAARKLHYSTAFRFVRRCPIMSKDLMSRLSALHCKVCSFSSFVTVAPAQSTMHIRKWSPPVNRTVSPPQPASRYQRGLTPATIQAAQPCPRSSKRRALTRVLRLCKSGYQSERRNVLARSQQQEAAAACNTISLLVRESC